MNLVGCQVKVFKRNKNVLLLEGNKCDAQHSLTCNPLSFPCKILQSLVIHGKINHKHINATGHGRIQPSIFQFSIHSPLEREEDERMNKMVNFWGRWVCRALYQGPEKKATMRAELHSKPLCNLSVA